MSVHQDPLLGETAGTSNEEVSSAPGTLRVLLGYGASRTGYTTLQSGDNEPPAPLQGRIHPKTWKRFKGHVLQVFLTSMLTSDYDNKQAAMTKRCVSYLWPIWFILWIFHLVGAAGFDNDVLENIFLALSVVFAVLIIYSTWVDTPHMKMEQYNRVLEKMQPTFWAQGYRVTLGSFWEFGWFWQRRFYVTFTPHNQPLAGAATDEEATSPGNALRHVDAKEPDELDAFNPTDWYLLEGTWIRTSAGKPSPTFRWIHALHGESTSLIWTFTNTSNPETLLWEKEAKLCMFFGMCPTTTTTTSRVVRQTNDGEDGETTPTTTSNDPSYLNALEYIPSKPDSRVQQALRQATRLRPLFIPRDNETGSGRDAYYLQGDQSVWRVRNATTGGGRPTTLTQYNFTFLEDMPSHQDILQGILDQLDPKELDENCMVWHFERQGESEVGSLA